MSVRIKHDSRRSRQTDHRSLMPSRRRRPVACSSASAHQPTATPVLAHRVTRASAPSWGRHRLCPIADNRDRHRPVADNFGLAIIATSFIDTTIVYNFVPSNSDRAVFDEPTVRRCASRHQQHAFRLNRHTAYASSTAKSFLYIIPLINKVT